MAVKETFPLAVRVEQIQIRSDCQQMTAAQPTTHLCFPDQETRLMSRGMLLQRAHHPLCHRPQRSEQPRVGYERVPEHDVEQSSEVRDV